MIRRAMVGCCVVLLCVSTALVARASPGERLGGYDALSSASAFSFRPFLPALVSTGDVPFEGTVALSSARVKSGGSSFGRGALVWPGSGAANLGPILGAAFGQYELGALIPTWPFGIDASQDSGEVTAGPSPLLSYSASGYPDRGGGDVRLADVHIPGLIHIEHVASTSTSIAGSDSVSSTSRVTLHGVSLLEGHVKIETIRSTSTTTSTGSAASTSGDVDVVGMKIGGVDVSVTDEGFQVTGLPQGAESFPGAGGRPFPGQSPQEYVNQVLASFGARLTLFDGVAKVSGGRADRFEPGLVLSLDNPVGGRGPIPPGRFDILIASSASSALATPPFEPGTVAQVSLGDQTSRPSASISIGGGPTVSGETVSALGTQLTTSAAPVPQGGGPALPVQTRLERYSFDGVPIGMTIALLLLALIAARFVRNFFDRSIGPERRR